MNREVWLIFSNPFLDITYTLSKSNQGNLYSPLPLYTYRTDNWTGFRLEVMQTH